MPGAGAGGARGVRRGHRACQSVLRMRFERGDPRPGRAKPSGIENDRGGQDLKSGGYALPELH